MDREHLRSIPEFEAAPLRRPQAQHNESGKDYQVGETLAAALRKREFHAEAFSPTPPKSPIDVVNVYYDRRDRYPTASVWEPFEDDGWQWGDNYEHNAPADISIDELADRVIATLSPR